MSWAFAPLPPQHFTTAVIDPPWKWSGGTKSRPQHYRRMSLDEVKELPVRELLRPEGGRVLLWITPPLLHRVPEIARAWRLRYSSTIAWVKLWPGEDGMFIYAGSIARGTGLEVVGAVEYVAILKAGRPQSIKGRPFPGAILAARREHSRKPHDLFSEVMSRLSGPFCEIFSRSSRPGWSAYGDETGKFDGVAA